MEQLDLIREVVSAGFIGLGALLCLIGAIGILRLPDFYTRLHAAGINDTAGAGFILVGLALHSGANLVSVKLIMVLFFLVVTSPTATHALVSAARARRLQGPPEAPPAETP